METCICINSYAFLCNCIVDGDNINIWTILLMGGNFGEISCWIWLLRLEYIHLDVDASICTHMQLYAIREKIAFHMTFVPYLCANDIEWRILLYLHRKKMGMCICINSYAFLCNCILYGGKINIWTLLLMNVHIINFYIYLYNFTNNEIH